ETRYATVTVEGDRVTVVQVDSGIELAGRSPQERAPARWFAYDATSDQLVAQVDGRWGFTPLPPGKYVVSVLQHFGEKEVRYAAVEVEAGTVTTVRVGSG